MENPSNPSPKQILFAETVLEIFTPTLAKYGFKVDSTTIEHYHSKLIFKKDKQSVEISSSTYPLDYPYSYDIRLGDSGFSWIYLSSLHSEAEGFNNSEYNFPFPDEVRTSISNASQALIKFAEPFLLGDPKFLSEADARLEKKRPKDDTFIIWTPPRTRRRS